MSSSTGVEVYLIGELESTISGNKLPSNLQALKCLLYNTRVKKLTLRQSCKIVLQKIKEFWTRADIPTLEARNSTQKLLNLQKKFSKLEKSQTLMKNHTESQTTLIKEFVAMLDDLFDIAPRHVAEDLDDERMQFLTNQRKKGRVGVISDDDDEDEDEQKENSVNEMNKIVSPGNPRKRKIDQGKPVKAADEEKEEDVDASKKKPKKVAAGSASKDDDSSSTASGEQEANSSDEDADQDGPSGPKKVRKSARKPSAKK